MALPEADKNKKADNRTTMDLGAVLPLTAEVRGSHLYIGGVDMVQLARDLGTALYVFDEADLRFRMESYRSAFRSRYEKSDIVFASKAFINKAVVRLVEEEGLCLDVSGGGELACARAVGFPMERVVVHGNNKTPQELDEAITAGVGRIVVDSRIELARISRIAARHGVVQDIYLRITPGVEADTHAYIQTGCEDSKFGFNMRDDWAFTCVKDALETAHVHLVGLHMHIGSQIFALHSYPEAIRVMVSLMARVKQEYGQTIEELDVGGGLGIAYTAEDRPSSIDEFAEVVTTAVRNCCEEHGLALPRLLCEPGRSLVANAGVTLYTVGILKTLPGIRKYVAIDGGMSDNIRTALYHAVYEPVIANKADEPRTEIVTLCGKHCESGDAVVIDMPLQHPDIDDIVCVFATGAYNHTMASNYNGQPRPAIVFVKDGEARVVTRRESYDDLMARDLESH
ncbi:MAG: diaminopimelate decarboxylase [Coriobacteriaceae bacterium]|jgi:diaminopimelate decarboxylase|nr:diaminopimelate decarboxylase [Coriobacteriaceae bacterium]